MVKKAELYVPAEWDKHEACWMAWPTHSSAWGGHLLRAQRQFVAFCKALAESKDAERIELLVANDDAEAQAKKALGEFDGQIHYRKVPYGDIWLRDTGPIFARSGSGLKAVQFTFNGWGGRYVYDNDESVGAAIAKARRLKAKTHELVLEGGALETNGAGTCITTRSVVLNDNRNPEMEEEHFEKILASTLGIRKVIWLDWGLMGDHTDGHVDNLARFVAPEVVMHMQATTADDANQATLSRIRGVLAESTDADGKPFKLVSIPSPGRITSSEGKVMAASYLNFYIANGAVIVPAFGSRMDRLARDAIAAQFPKRQVVSLDARGLLEGGGTFHCMTLQEPQVG